MLTREETGRALDTLYAARAFAPSRETNDLIGQALRLYRLLFLLDRKECVSERLLAEAERLSRVIGGLL